MNEQLGSNEDLASERNLLGIVRNGLGSIGDNLRDRDFAGTIRNGLKSIRDDLRDELRDRFLDPTEESSKALSALVQEMKRSSNKDLASEMISGDLFGIVGTGVGSIRDNLRDRDFAGTIRNGLRSIRDDLRDEVSDSLDRLLDGGENENGDVSPTEKSSKSLSALMQKSDFASNLRLLHNNLIRVLGTLPPPLPHQQ